MAFDGLFLTCVRQELEAKLLQTRVDKIYQPSREEIILSLRGRSGGYKLLLSASANGARAHLTTVAVENPKVPPMFCMLLRKHLSAGRLVAVRQLNADRVLFLDFETINELGDREIMTLAAEFMGRHSNLMLLHEDGRIVDAIKRITDEISSVRQVLPGMAYRLPPSQDKLNPLTATREEAKARFSAERNQSFAKAILNVYEGLSPVIAREAAFVATGGLDLYKNEVSDYRMNRLFDYLDGIRNRIETNTQHYCTLSENGRLKDFTFVPIEQYGSYLTQETYPTASELLDHFFAARDSAERMKQRSHDLLKLLVNTSDRVRRKLAIQQEELAQSVDREPLRMQGDLLNANLYRMEKGMRTVTVENFYEPDCAPITIALDVRLTPSQNAQKYYTEYRKAKTAEEKLRTLIVQGEEELVYLDSVFDALTRATGEADLLEIRRELAEQGYLKMQRGKQKQLKQQPPMKFLSSDGFTILCGRNNRQNDQLTLKTAHNYDLWLHTQKIAGSHVIVVADGKEIPDRTIEEAAIIAAYHSHGRDSSQVPVDYTRVKFVKKPNGAKPGMVIFTNYQTAYVTPDPQLVERLEQAAKEVL